VRVGAAAFALGLSLAGPQAAGVAWAEGSDSDAGSVSAGASSAESSTAESSTAESSTGEGLVAALGIHLFLTFLRRADDRFLDDCRDQCSRHVTSRVRVTGNEN
jgi:hypothetical protein